MDINSSTPPALVREVPLIPVRDVVVFPHNEIVLTFGRKKSVASINAALNRDKLVALFTQKDAGESDPTVKDLYSIGTLCVVERTLKSDNELNVLVKGTARIKLSREVASDPFQRIYSVPLASNLMVNVCAVVSAL